MRHYATFFAAIVFLTANITLAAGPYLANGIKIGEVDQTSAIIWTRTTQDPQATPSIENAAPGMPGEVRVRYWEADTPDHRHATDWAATDPERDFVLQVPLKYLRAGTKYGVLVETRPLGLGQQHIGASNDPEPPTSKVEGSFRTPADPDTPAPVEFIVVTCQAIGSVDCGDEGHSPYRLMPKLDADFFVHTGDIVYYDKVPLCKNMEQARWKWNRMYGYFLNRDFHSGIASYFMKDDHDTLKNDCWAGQTYGDLTWEQGLGIFREQVPMGEKTYRTIRWGRDVQIWLTENRDFRSPNNIPDGPDKTIFGKEQKEWLWKTVQESDATFKFLIMPGPLVGPDKRGKADNHCNDCFKNEGDQLRELVASQKNMFVMNGDRHWQYWSVHPELGINEFGCGPINDLHDYGGNPGYQEEYHKYFSGKGGWLAVTVERDENGTPTATMRHYATGPDMTEPEVRHETTFIAE